MKNGLPPLSTVELVALGAGHLVSEQVARRIGAQRREIQARCIAVAQGGGQRDAQLRRELRRAKADRAEHRPARGMGDEMADQLDRAGVGPLHVVEHEHDGRLGGERGDQPADGPVRAVALLLQLRPASGGELLEGGEDDRELGCQVARQLLQAPRVEAHEPVVERVAEDAERQLGLELGGAAGQHEVAAGPRAGAQLPQQPALADARLAGDLEHPAERAVVEFLQRVRDQPQLRVAAHQGLLARVHGRLPGTARRRIQVAKRRRVERRITAKG